jgi:HD-like signal output (HDOD) protein
MTNEESLAEITAQNSLIHVKQFIARMPNLPTTVMKVLEICNDSSSSPNELKKVIELDPVLTGKVLKLINSAYYSFPVKNISLTRAIIMLGLNTVKNLALATSLLTVFKSNSALRGGTVDMFWEHSLRVGVTAKIIAQTLQIPVGEQEEYFLAGLLHDLGKLPLMACFAKVYIQLIHDAAQQKVCSCEAENCFLKLDHCQVNWFIAEKWNLGPSISNVLVYHHTPFKYPLVSHCLLHTVSLANHLTHHFHVNDDKVDPYELEQTEFFKQNRQIDVEKLLSLQPEIEEQIEGARVFLKISGKG